MPLDPLRKEIGGVSLDQDMLYRVTGPNFVAGFTVYNGEITGCAPILVKLCRGTALFAINECTRLGWKCEFIEDRR